MAVISNLVDQQNFLGNFFKIQVSFCGSNETTPVELGPHTV